MIPRLRLDGRTSLVALLLASGAFLAYAAWLGWDHTYQVDPATGRSSGPYEGWQVVGCALTLAAVVLVAGVLHHPLLALVVVPLVFTVTWSIPAAGSDETGLWVVGAVMLLVGTAAGTAVLAFVADALRIRTRS